MSEGKEVVGTGKIRDSCNSCSSQKIRCGKERPSCARCASKELMCEYSISMRTGRPSRAQSRAREAAAAAAAAAAAESHSDSSPPRSAPGSSQQQPTSSSNQNVSTTFGSYTPDIGSSQMTAESILAQLSQDVPSDEEFWAQEGDNLHMGFQTNMDGLYSMVPSDTQFMDLDWEFPPDVVEQPIQEQTVPEQPVMSISNTNAQRPQLQLEMPSILPQATQQTEQPNRAHSSPDEHSNTPSQSNNSSTPESPCRSRGQNCLASLFQLALEMHVPNEDCNTVPSVPNRFVENGTLRSPDDSEPTIRGVDAVLFHNRAAIRLLSQTLDCPCAMELSVTLAAYLAASKIVAWYGAILGVETISATADSTHRRNSSMTERIVANPILMGSYSLDEEVHRSVRARVVVSELHTLVEPILAKLPQFHHALANINNNQGGWSSSSSSEHSSPIDQQKCMLREQLRRIFGEANRRIGR